jgi:hypothetical protein
MKVVFLDIDGVLNTRQTPNPRKFPYVVDKTLVRRLKRLLAQTKAKAYSRRHGVTIRLGCSAPAATAFHLSAARPTCRSARGARKFAPG